jgi:protein-disulfide isomerase
MNEDENTLAEPVRATDHAQGRTGAPITLVEYGDYECPYCGAAYPVLKEVQEQMGDNLRFVFRNFPLSEMHPHAFAAAEAAEAAGEQGKFWEMHDLLFEHQKSLGPQALASYAKKLALDTERFEKDINSGTPAAKVKRDFQTGLMSGVNGTPSLFVNGLRYDDAVDEESLLAFLRSFAAENGRGTKGVR